MSGRRRNDYGCGRRFLRPRWRNKAGDEENSKDEAMQQSFRLALRPPKAAGETTGSGYANGNAEGRFLSVPVGFAPQKNLDHYWSRSPFPEASGSVIEPAAPESERDFASPLPRR